MSKIILALLFLLVSGSAMAEHPETTIDPAEFRCMQADDETIDRLKDFLDVNDKAIPNIPPEESKYLEAEENKAKKLNDGTKNAIKAEKIWTKLLKRPMYQVWKIRNALAKVKDSLNYILDSQPAWPRSITTYRNNPEAEKIERATKLVIDMTSYEIELGIYINQLERGQASGITQIEFNQIVVGARLYDQVSNYISCKLAKLMGKQPV